MLTCDCKLEIVNMVFNSLSGEARSRYIMISENKTITEILNAFRDAYEDNTNLIDRIQKLHNLKQDSHESVADFADKLENIIQLSVGDIRDIVLVKNQKLANKVDNRWSHKPYVIVAQPNDDISVYRVKDIETNIVKLKHRNQLLPLYKS